MIAYIIGCAVCIVSIVVVLAVAVFGTDDDWLVR